MKRGTRTPREDIYKLHRENARRGSTCLKTTAIRQHEGLENRAGTRGEIWKDPSV